MAKRTDVISHINLPFATRADFDIRYGDGRGTGTVGTGPMDFFDHGLFFTGRNRCSDTRLFHPARVTQDSHDRTVGDDALVKYRDRDRDFANGTLPGFAGIGFLGSEMMAVGTVQMDRHDELSFPEKNSDILSPG